MQFDRDFHLVRTEIEFEQRIAARRKLSAFRRNPTTWELLLILALESEGFKKGLHEVPNEIGTRYLGSSALLKFIREQRDAGLIRFLDHEKRSKRVLQIDPDLAHELMQLLNWRKQMLTEHLAADPATTDNQFDGDVAGESGSILRANGFKP